MRHELDLLALLLINTYNAYNITRAGILMSLKIAKNALEKNAKITLKNSKKKKH